jgi:exodeoxyribonuclease VII small subunit
MTKKDFDYQASQTELADILDALQQADIDIDDAMRKYERGLELVRALEGYLNQAENKIEQLQAKLHDEA